jgi:hypothetical protein
MLSTAAEFAWIEAFKVLDGADGLRLLKNTLHEHLAHTYRDHNHPDPIKVQRLTHTHFCCHLTTNSTPAPCPAFSNRCPPCRIVSYSSSASLISLSRFSSSFASLPPLLPNLHRPLHNLLIPLHLPQNHLPYPLWSRSVSHPLQSLLVPRTSRNHTREYSRCCYGRHYHNAIFFPRGKVGHTSRSSWRKCGDHQEMGIGNRVM